MSSYPQDIQDILATIRYHESRGNYTIAPNKGNASGAYQFIESTWNRYGGYQHAYQAPPEVQDERAAADVNKFLDQWDGDVSMVPIMWYYPVASRNHSLLDEVPVPGAGNVLTIRQYQTRWLEKWSELSGKPIPARIGPPGAPPPGTATTTATPTSGTTGGDGTTTGGVDTQGTESDAPAGPSAAELLARSGAPPTPWDRGSRDFPSISFPVLGPSRVAAPDCDGPAAADHIATGLCSEARPAIVFGVKLQPVLAAVTGVVTDVTEAANGSTSVTLTDVYGRNYTYTGFNNDNPGTNDGRGPAYLELTALATIGESVWAGQVLGFMGDTASLAPGVQRNDVPADPGVAAVPSDVAPHIRLDITDAEGNPLDAYGPIIDALYYQLCHTGTGPWASVPTTETTTLIIIETTDDDTDVDSQWEITGTGQVRASGWAAMIYPTEGCAWIASGVYGVDAGGEQPADDDGWGVDVRLPLEVLLALGSRSVDGSPLPLVVQGL